MRRAPTHFAAVALHMMGQGWMAGGLYIFTLVLVSPFSVQPWHCEERQAALMHPDWSCVAALLCRSCRHNCRID